MRFFAFTNGTLVDDAFVQEIKRVGNFALAFSIEGYEDATDMRRGDGTYQKVLAAMEKMKAAGLPFGYSACYHSKNVEEVCSKEYIDFLVNKGALFAWYFTYMPVGKDAVPELIANADQRKKAYELIRQARKSSRSSRLISGTTENMCRAVSRVAATICTSMQTVMQSRAYLSIIQAQISVRIRFSSVCSSHCSSIQR